MDDVHTFCFQISIRSAIIVSCPATTQNLPTILSLFEGFIQEGNEVVVLAHLFVEFPTASGHNNQRLSQIFLRNTSPEELPIEFLFGLGSR